MTCTGGCAISAGMDLSRSVPPGPVEVAAVIATVCGFAFSAGLMYPVTALVLAGRGASQVIIGLNGAMTGLGVLVGALLLPRLIARYGGWSCLWVSMLCAAAVLAFFPWVENVVLWLFLRFLVGVFLNSLYVVGEAWLNAIVDNTRRNRVVAFYTATMGGSFAAGPALVPVLGYQGGLPFAVAVLVLVISILPLGLARSGDPLQGRDGETTIGMATVMWRAALLMGGVGVFGLFDGTTLGLLPVYALARGLHGTVAAHPLTWVVWGSVLLQIPIGWACDRIGMRLGLIGCTGVTAWCMALLPLLALDGWIGRGLLFVAGGTAFGVYTVALVLLGRRFRGPELAAGSAGFALMWGLGAVIGPGLVGLLMHAGGAEALPLFLAAVFFVACGLTIGLRRHLPDRFEPIAAMVTPAGHGTL